MKEHGLINRQGLHWFPKKPTCGSQQVSIVRQSFKRFYDKYELYSMYFLNKSAQHL